ncbi:hypothetical protein Tco_0559651 [Tanacetum coccineum]
MYLVKIIWFKDLEINLGSDEVVWIPLPPSILCQHLLDVDGKPSLMTGLSKLLELHCLFHAHYYRTSCLLHNKLGLDDNKAVNDVTTWENLREKLDEGFIVGYAAHSLGNSVGPKVHEASEMVESNSGLCIELLGLQRQEHEATILLRSKFSAGSIDPAASISAGSAEPFSTVIEPVHADETSLPPEMEDIYHHPSTGIFSSSSYDADFILGDLTSPVQTRGTLKKSKFGESTFVSYVHDQQRNNHTDYLHCLFACFLSQLEPSSVAQALNDSDQVLRFMKLLKWWRVIQTM